MTRWKPIIDEAPRHRTAVSPPAAETWFGRSPWLLALVLVIVTLAVYFPVLRGGFVFDDDSLITVNSTIKASDGLYRFWFTTEAIQAVAGFDHRVARDQDIIIKDKTAA